MTARTIAAVLAAGLATLPVFAPRASATERTPPGPYDLNAYRPSSQMQNPATEGWLGPANIERIETYESRETCRHAAQFVRVDDKHKNWRLRCDPVEGWRVR